VNVGSGNEPLNVASFRGGDECLRATFKVFQKTSYPFFIQLSVDIIDQKKWTIIMPRSEEHTSELQSPQ